MQKKAVCATSLHVYKDSGGHSRGRVQGMFVCLRTEVVVKEEEEMVVAVDEEMEKEEMEEVVVC